MRPVYFIFPGDPETNTGGYAFDRALIAGLKREGIAIQSVVLPGTYPVPDQAAIDDAARLLDAIEDGALVIFDGLAYGVLPDLAQRLGMRTVVVALVHHPLCDETGVDDAERQRFFASESRALSHASGVLVTSAFTAKRLSVFGVDQKDITVVEPGIRRRPVSAGSGGPGVSLLSVATVTRRKAYPDLLAALRPLEALPWELHCAGSLTLDPAHAEEVLSMSSAYGDRVRFHGGLTAEALDSLYHQADLFVSTSHYEGYGMAIGEAAACGLPIIAAAGGAVPMTAGGRLSYLYEPGDINALTGLLEKLIQDGRARQEMRETALNAVSDLPNWESGTLKVMELLNNLGGRT